VIELQHERVRLSAVNARMRLEELDQILGPFRRKRALSPSGVLDVLRSVVGVVLVVIIGAAGLAVVVPLAESLPSPRELA
jgi:hypothetical protein